VDIGAGRAGIEGIEVGRRPGRELFDLAFPDCLAGAAADGLDRAVEGASCCLDPSKLAQAVGVALDRQIEGAVGGMQVRVTTLAVGETRHDHLTEHGCEQPLMSRLGRSSGHALGVADLAAALLALGAHVEMALERQAQHFAAIERDARFELGVGHAGSTGAFQEPDQCLQPVSAPREGVGAPGRVVHRRGRARRAESRATSSASPALPWSSTRFLAAR